MSTKTNASIKQHSASTVVNESETTTCKQNHHDLQTDEDACMDHFSFNRRQKLNKQTCVNQLAPVGGKKSSPQVFIM